MRGLTLFVSLWLASLASAADAIRILSWNLDWFPSGSPLRSAPDEETNRLKVAADVLRSSGADVFVLQEIRDAATADKLARTVGGTCELVICSTFRESIGGSLVWQQIAILSEIPAKSAWAESWSADGQVDPPRGFAFALFQVDGANVAVYGIHLKSNLRSEDERQNQLNILKRELAVEEVLGHRQVAEEKSHTRFDAVVVAGDFNTNMEDLRFASEGTLRHLVESGFSTQFAARELSDRATMRSKGRYPATIFDYIYQAGGTWVKPVEVLDASISDHRPICGSFRLAAP